MNYIGIDIAKYDHVVGVRSDDGAPHGKARSFSNDADGFKTLMDRFQELEVTAESSIVAMESTGHYWMALYVFLIDHGYRVAVVNPILTDAFRKADTVRKTKTDQIDAFLIAEYARFKQLAPSEISLEDTDGLKQLTRYRSHLVKERTMLKNKATAVVDRLFPEFAVLFSDLYLATPKALLERYATPEAMATADIRSLTKTVEKASHGRCGRAKAEQIKALAKSSIGITFASEALAFEVKHMVALIGHLDEQIKKLDGEIARILECSTGGVLETIPGIGPVNAAVIAAEIGDANRFSDPKKLIAFAGIDASKTQSGTFEGTEEHMSKRGSSYLRYALLLSADKARQCDPYFGDYYDSMRARGKHHYVAVSGVARKLAGTILAVMKEQRPYESRPSIQSLKDANKG
ncbi:MAG: IS110 family transposase [Raoultibacter sp.]